MWEGRWAAPLCWGVVACAVRAAAAASQWSGNPTLRRPTLDAAYYLDWARAIRAGGLGSAGGIGPGEPYILNPLYAFLIAPLAGTAETAIPSILALQTLLGGLTAAVVAIAARRHGGALAAWTAGGLVAFSTASVHLSTHVSVATLAGLLVALAVIGCAPRTDGRRSRGLLAGGALALGALARPVTLLALPLVAIAQARLGGRRALITTLSLFAVCAGASFARNVAVSGEPVTFTAANGQNLHLGNNPLARATRSMQTDEFHFSPLVMHEDAKHRVAFDLAREPTRVEISDWFRSRALAEWRRVPGESIAYHLQKLRWFLSPSEPASSADLVTDLGLAPWLRLGWLPTWVLAVLAGAGVWFVRRDRALLLGAGGLVAAHVAACTLSFPLSHYRAPAVPALAVLAAVAVSRVMAGRRRQHVLAAALVGALSVLAWWPPQPAYTEATRESNRAVDALQEQRFVEAGLHAERALTLQPGWTPPMLQMADSLLGQGEFAAARDWADRAARRQPWNVAARRMVALLDVDLGRPDAAVEALDALVATFPWSAPARGARGRVRAFAGDAAGAREDLSWAIPRGYDAQPDALERAGLPVPGR